MNDSTEIKLAGLQGHLRGMRLVAKSQVRIAHRLAENRKGTSLEITYRRPLPSLIANLQNVRQAERELAQIRKELENAED